MAQWDHLVSAIKSILPEYRVKISQFKKPTSDFTKDFFIRFVNYIHSKHDIPLTNWNAIEGAMQIPILVSEVNKVLPDFEEGMRIDLFDILDPAKNTNKALILCLNVIVFFNSFDQDFQEIKSNARDLFSQKEIMRGDQTRLLEEKNCLIIENEKLKMSLNDEESSLLKYQAELASMKLSENNKQLQVKYMIEQISDLEVHVESKQTQLQRVAEETEIVRKELAIVKQHDYLHEQVCELESRQYNPDGLSQTLEQKQADIKKLSGYISGLEEHGKYLAKLCKNGDSLAKMSESLERYTRNLHECMVSIEDSKKRRAELEDLCNDVKNNTMSIENATADSRKNLNALKNELNAKLADNQRVNKENEANKVKFRDMVQVCKDLEADIKQLYAEATVKYQNRLVSVGDMQLAVFNNLERMYKICEKYM